MGTTPRLKTPELGSRAGGKDHELVVRWGDGRARWQGSDDGGRERWRRAEREAAGLMRRGEAEHGLRETEHGLWSGGKASVAGHGSNTGSMAVAE
ncbi:hypothetical protein M0R45_026133 [Rubus argutus]|uniref:MHC class I antigen n=1 Tax=Rubus argutus TaxID=59490 RepID=A0AAW1WZ72_RUBAR